MAIRLPVIYAPPGKQYRQAEFRNIGLIRSEFKIADDMKKLKGNGTLFRAMVSGRVVHPVEIYIVRPCEMYAMGSCSGHISYLRFVFKLVSCCVSSMQ
jgi:hypothetical protein